MIPIVLTINQSLGQGAVEMRPPARTFLPTDEHQIPIGRALVADGPSADGPSSC